MSRPKSKAKSKAKATPKPTPTPMKAAAKKAPKKALKKAQKKASKKAPKKVQTKDKKIKKGKGLKMDYNNVYSRVYHMERKNGVSLDEARMFCILICFKVNIQQVFFWQVYIIYWWQARKRAREAAKKCQGAWRDVDFAQ